jgi:hypothetical protein
MPLQNIFHSGQGSFIGAIEFEFQRRVRRNHSAITVWKGDPCRAIAQLYDEFVSEMFA